MLHCVCFFLLQQSVKYNLHTHDLESQPEAVGHNQSFLFRFIYLFYCWVGNTRSLTKSDLRHNLPQIFIKNFNENAISYLFICLFVNINYLDNDANTIHWLTVTLVHTSPFVPPTIWLIISHNMRTRLLL